MSDVCMEFQCLDVDLPKCPSCGDDQVDWWELDEAHDDEVHCGACDAVFAITRRTTFTTAPVGGWTPDNGGYV